MANLEDRVTVLEQRMDMEAGLAASRDRDLSELTTTVRSHTRMLQAVQERQAEHSKILEHHTTILGQQTAILREHSLRLASVEEAVGALRQMTTEGFAALGGQLQLLIDRDPGPRD